MNRIAIIPARGGSKRIPGKNIKHFRGKPIIAYSIQAALQSNLFDIVMVSTDSEEIAGVAKAYGANVPFLRSATTADDYSSTASVISEVLGKFKDQGTNIDYACCIYPTAPFVTVQSIKKGYETLCQENYTTVFPVCAFSYPVYRGLSIERGNKAVMIWPENLNKRSQDLPLVYHDAGQFYWIDVQHFLKEEKLFCDNSGTIILDETEVQDIDNTTDWIIAELKHSILYPNNE